MIGLRRSRHGIEEIVAELERAGTPLSRTAVWEILKEAGLSRMPRPAAKPNGEGEPERLSAPKVHVLAASGPSRAGLRPSTPGCFC